jgi:hypothetical protein
MQRQMFAGGGAAGLKPIPAGNMGLPNLPEGVRNNMGYMAEGGDPMMMSEGIMSTAPAMGAPSPEMMAQQGAEMMDPNTVGQMIEGAEAAGFSDPEAAGSFEEMMNSVSGENKSAEERRSDLASIVGPEDAGQTPESVLALVTPVVELALVDQGIGPMAQEQMNTPIEGDMGEGIMTMAANGNMGVGNEPPVNFNLGGEVRRRGDEDPVPVFMNGGPVQYFAPENTNRVAGKGFNLNDLLSALTKTSNSQPTVPDLQKTFEDKKGIYSSILGDPEEQKKMTQAQMLFDIANTALTFAAPMPGEKSGLSPAQRLAMAATTTKLPQTISARAAESRSQQQKLDLAALQSAEKEVATAKASELEYNKALIKNRTKPSLTSIFSKDGVSVPVTQFVTSTGVVLKDNAGVVVDFNKGPYKDYTLKAPAKITKNVKTLYDKDDNTKTITGVEIDGVIYEDASKSKKVDMSKYSLVAADKDALKTENYYLKDGTSVPLLIRNGNLVHATPFGNKKSGDPFDEVDPIFEGGSFKKLTSDFTKPKSYMKYITDVDFLTKYANAEKGADGQVKEKLSQKDLTQLNTAITQYLAMDTTVGIGGTQTSRELMLPPLLKQAIITRFQKGLPIPDAATVYLQNTESDFDLGILSTADKLFSNDFENGGVNVDNADSIFLSGEKEPKLLEAQGWFSGLKSAFEGLKAQLAGELTGSIQIYPVQEARKVLNGLALRTVEIQADLFEGNKLKAVMDMIIDNSADIQGGTFTSDSDLYNALTKNRKNLGVVLREFTGVLKNKKQFRTLDVIKARKGAKKVLNLIGEYTAFIDLIERESSSRKDINKIKVQNKVRDKLYNKFKNQAKGNK